MMDLVKSWLAAVVALVAAVIGTATFGILVVSPDWVTSALGGPVWAGGAAFVMYGLTTVAAGLAHRVRRPRPARTALAVLPVPALGILASPVTALVRGSSLSVAAAEVVLGVAGVTVGWVLVRNLRGRREGRTGGATQAAYRY